MWYLHLIIIVLQLLYIATGFSLMHLPGSAGTVFTTRKPIFLFCYLWICKHVSIYIYIYYCFERNVTRKSTNQQIDYISMQKQWLLVQWIKATRLNNKHKTSNSRNNECPVVKAVLLCWYNSLLTYFLKFKGVFPTPANSYIKLADGSTSIN